MWNYPIRQKFQHTVHRHGIFRDHRTIRNTQNALASISASRQKKYPTQTALQTRTHHTTPSSFLGVSKQKVCPSKDNIETEVLVIGGGVTGLSIQYHLLKKGINVTLIESDELSSGTTWHTAGMVWSLNASDTYVDMIDDTKTMIHELQANTQETIWSQNGGLFLASQPSRTEELHRLKALGEYFGIVSHIIAPHEVCDLHPIMDATTVHAGLYSPTDGTVDPTALTTALRKSIHALQGNIITKDTITNIEYHVAFEGGRSVKRVTGASTKDKKIKAKCVVNATGAWSNTIMSMLGEKIPLRTIKHAYVTTETIPNMKSTFPNVRDLDLSIYLRTQGTAISVGGYEENPDFWKPVNDFHFGLFDLDYNTFEENYTNAIHRCPVLNDVGIQSTVCGPESFTPDHRPLVGFHPGIRGLFQACGLNSMGILLSGGLGKQCSNWIIDGTPQLDLFHMDVSRFHPRECYDTAIDDMTAEAYHKTYATHYRHDEPLTGRGKRTSPLHSLLEKNGCFFEYRHGYERPGWFSQDVLCDHYDNILKGELSFGKLQSHDAIHQECWAARTGAVLIDQSYMGKLIISGKDADECVSYLCANDPTIKSDNSITYTPLCNSKGGVEADLTVLKFRRSLVMEDPHVYKDATHDVDPSVQTQYYFSTGGTTVTHDYEFIHKTLCEKFPGKDFRVANVSDDFAVLSLQGPTSGLIMNTLFGDGFVDGLEFSTSTVAMLDIDFVYSSFKNTLTTSKQAVHKNTIPVRIFRLTFVGELGYELLIPAHHAVDAYNVIDMCGEQVKIATSLPYLPAGYRAVMSLSAEKGYRHWHADLTNQDSPLEALIGFTVRPRLKRGCINFLGGVELRRQLDNGVAKKLVAFSVGGLERFQGFETIKRNNQPVGLVKFTEYGHTVDKTIAYGYIDKDNIKQAELHEWTIQDVPVTLYKN